MTPNNNNTYKFVVCHPKTTHDMLGREYDFERKIASLREREKELRCLYNLEELIRKDLQLKDFFAQLVKRIPSGWQYPEICRAAIEFEGDEFREEGWEKTDWHHGTDIVIDQHRAGRITVYYLQSRPLVRETPFLPEEQKLLNNIAHRTGLYIFNMRLRQTIDYIKNEKPKSRKDQGNDILNPGTDEHWRWRLRMCELIAEKADMKKYGIKGIYVIGSTKTTEAGPASDIDLLIHVHDKNHGMNEFLAWLDGWSHCLDEVNYSKTGYRSDGLLDVHLITDEDVANKTSYGVMLDSMENSAKPLRTN